MSSPTQGRGKTQQERQTEKRNGDRPDGWEKTESPAGTRRVKDQQQGAEGPGVEACIFYGPKNTFFNKEHAASFYGAIE